MVLRWGVVVAAVWSTYEKKANNNETIAEAADSRCSRRVHAHVHSPFRVRRSLRIHEQHDVVLRTCTYDVRVMVIRGTATYDRVRNNRTYGTSSSAPYNTARIILLSRFVRGTASILRASRGTADRHNIYR